MGDRLPNIQMVSISDIEVKDAPRSVSAAGVATLKTTLIENGSFSNPIVLNRRKSGLRLIDGGHRLAAALELGHTTILSRIERLSDKKARLLSIDLNLAGEDLCEIDTAVFIAERKRIYEEMYPNTKHGIAGMAVRWNTDDIVSFVSATAAKYDWNPQKVYRLARIGRDLRPKDAARLKLAPKKVDQAQLLALAKMTDPIQREAVIAKLSTGDAPNVAKALKQLSDEPVREVDPVEASLDKFLIAWKRLPKEVRRRFVQVEFKTIGKLMVEIDQKKPKK